MKKKRDGRPVSFIIKCSDKPDMTLMTIDSLHAMCSGATLAVAISAKSIQYNFKGEAEKHRRHAWERSREKE